MSPAQRHLHSAATFRHCSPKGTSVHPFIKATRLGHARRVGARRDPRRGAGLRCVIKAYRTVSAQCRRSGYLRMGCLGDSLGIHNCIICAPLYKAGTGVGTGVAAAPIRHRSHRPCRPRQRLPPSGRGGPLDGLRDPRPLQRRAMQACRAAIAATVRVRFRRTVPCRRERSSRISIAGRPRSRGTVWRETIGVRGHAVDRRRRRTPLRYRRHQAR